MGSRRKQNRTTRIIAQAPLLAILLAFVIPTQVSIVVLLHTHDEHAVHAHFGGAASAGFLSDHDHDHGHGHDHDHDHDHGIAFDSKPDRLPSERLRLDDGNRAPSGVVLVLSRTEEITPAPTKGLAWSHPGISSPFLPIEGLRRPALHPIVDPTLNARPPPRRGLDRILNTSHALLL